MPTDYEALLLQNLKEYGEGDRHLKHVGELYSDRTHFIYELLQNAEDAGAHFVHFHLHKDRLEVRHDGRKFTEADVRGVCGIADGTKADDPASIGRFGLGFKSVYAYTMTPEVHSGEEHFRIHGIIRPRAVLGRSDQGGETTLIVLPFDRPAVDAADAFAAIGAKLRSLTARSLLFLAKIVKIDWSVEDGLSGSYHRTKLGSSFAGDLRPRRVGLHGQASDGARDAEQWLIFKRQIETDAGVKARPVEIAFRLRRGKDGAEFIEPIEGSCLVVSFATEKEIHCGFLLQGPFATTPARDNVRLDHPLNRLLCREAATLLVQTLGALRDAGMLTISAIRAMPIIESDFPSDHLLRPLYEAVRESFKTEALLPTASGGYLPAASVRLPHSRALRDLLDREQLTRLLGGKLPIDWLPPELEERESMAVQDYLRRVLSVEELRIEVHILPRLTPGFMRRQTDDWMIRLYQFLSKQRALRASGSALYQAPILRLKNGTHVSIQHALSPSSRVYLPPPSPTSFLVVRPGIAADDGVRAFLGELGFSEPSALDDLVENVLPKYGNDESPTRANLEADAPRVFEILSTGSPADRRRLTDELQDKSLIWATTPPGQMFRVRPGRAYLETAPLRLYFGQSPDIYFAADFFVEMMRRAQVPAEQLGIVATPRVLRVDANLDQACKWALRNEGPRSKDLPSLDFEVVGLKEFLHRIVTAGSPHNFAHEGRPSPSDSEFGGEEGGADSEDPLQLAQILWGFLCDFAQGGWNLDGCSFLCGRYRWVWYRERSAEFPASWLTLLRTTRWLPDRLGSLHVPEEVDLSQLPLSFRQDAEVGRVLDMGTAAVAQFGRESGIDSSLLKRVVAKLKDDPDAASRFLAETPLLRDGGRSGSVPGSANEEGEGDGEEDLNYREALLARFGRSGSSNAPSPAPSLRNVADPAFRRARLAESLKHARSEALVEPARFRRVPIKVWEGKDRLVRATLAEWYGGRCQACSFTFTKRDGQPYFEGLYLVPSSRASWIDRTGNVLSLCANCCAKLEHGAVVVNDLLGQVTSYRAKREGGTGEFCLRITICGEGSQIRFDERHIMELQALVSE